MRYLLPIAVAGALAAAPLTAQAGQITLNNSTSGSITFTGTGTGDIKVTNTTLSGQGSDSVDATLGTYTLSGFTATATSAGSGVWNFPAGTTASFSYTNGANSIGETWTFSSINDGSVNPHFKATDSVTSISGSAAFQSAFGPVGSASTVDFSTLNIATVLDTLANTTNSETTKISSGEDVTVASEPTSLAVLGFAIAGILGWRSFARRSV